MRTTTFGWIAISAGVALGCGMGSEDPVDFGRRALASLDEPCEGIAGLTGRAVLDQRFDHVATTLGYVTASGTRVSPTALTIDLGWPASPVAVCYPEYASVGPRVAIEGLSMRFVTADGKLDETLPANAWLTSLGGAPSLALAVAASPRSALHGSWTPFPDYDNGGSTLLFVARLLGASSGQAGGNVGLGDTSLAEAGAAVFRSGNAVAVWPSPP